MLNFGPPKPGVEGAQVPASPDLLLVFFTVQFTKPPAPNSAIHKAAGLMVLAVS